MAPREKVLWLIKGLGMGGAERLLEAAIPHFDRDTYDYEVAYCLAHKNEVVPTLEHANIPIFCLNFRRNFDPGGFYRLFRLIRDRKPQVLHLHLPYTGILGRVIGRLNGVKGIVYTEHNILDTYHPLTRMLNLLTYPLSRKTISVSEEVQRSLMKHRLARSTELLVIRNGIDLNSESSVSPDMVKQALGIPTNHQVVGNVAHVQPAKGQEYLLQAAKLVLDRCPEVTFLIVGREKMNGGISHLEELASELGIRDHVVFTGFREDVYDLMRVFDIFTLSSLYEGLPIALLEAMLLYKPVVVTSVGGIPEVIKDEVNGFLVPPKNPKALAERIVQLLQDNVLGTTISQMAAQTVREQFSMQEMVRKVEQVYSAVLAH